jgi:hypothetical protein
MFFETCSPSLKRISKKYKSSLFRNASLGPVLTFVCSGFPSRLDVEGDKPRNQNHRKELAGHSLQDHKHTRHRVNSHNIAVAD